VLEAALEEDDAGESEARVERALRTVGNETGSRPA
jgi:hypothetical protein